MGIVYGTNNVAAAGGAALWAAGCWAGARTCCRRVFAAYGPHAVAGSFAAVFMAAAAAVGKAQQKGVLQCGGGGYGGVCYVAYNSIGPARLFCFVAVWPVCVWFSILTTYNVSRRFYAICRPAAAGQLRYGKPYPAQHRA